MVAPELTVTELISKYKLRPVVLYQLKLDNEDLLKDNTDFFSLGLSSFNVLHIVVAIQGIKDIDFSWVDYATINQHPTLAGLARRLARGIDNTPTPTTETVLIDQLIDKYSDFVDHKVVTREATGEHHIVLTGVTGSLGGHIASQLAGNASVAKVYCLVRPNRLNEPRERVMTHLGLRGLNVSRDDKFDGDDENVSTTDPATDIYPKYTCTPEQFTKIVVYSSDLTREDLGLTSQVYKLFLETVTDVIHCAWAVNYDIGLSSFEHLIHGSYNLISLCTKSDRPKPASFHFISSLAAAGGEPIKEVHYNNSHTISGGLGYGQSKFVVERLCSIAVRKVPTMVARVLRFGYISGDTMNGNWDTKEEYPMIAKSAIDIKTLPCPPHDEILFWLPVDDAATVCIELALGATAAPKDAVFNVVQPTPISWNDVVLAGIMGEVSGITAELPTKWLERLKGEVSPPYQLLGYFYTKYAGDAAIHPAVETAKATEYSAHLRTCKPVDMALVVKYVESWMLGERMKIYAEKKASMMTEGAELVKKNELAKKLAKEKEAALAKEKLAEE